ncbi:hypothetical protein BGX28_000646 [Mortierella sp. GBA30]|nr:hypothetical protein BGX28_000646 [Mortierella sp. GBA30]
MVYILYGLLLIPIFLSIVPAITRARNFKMALLSELLLLTLLAFWLARVEPFNKYNPASLYFSQYYNQTSRSSYVDLVTDAGQDYLDRILRNVPSVVKDKADAGSNSVVCSPLENDDGDFESCRFRPARQVFEDPGGEVPLHVEWLSPSVQSAGKWREGRLQILALESRLCSVFLAETTPGMETELWTEFMEMPGENNSESLERVRDHSLKVLHVLVREWNRAWIVRVRARAQNATQYNPPTENSVGAGSEQGKIPLRVVCGYDDWNSGHGYATEFNHLRANIPIWTRMKGSRNNDESLFNVGVDLHF